MAKHKPVGIVPKPFWSFHRYTTHQPNINEHWIYQQWHKSIMQTMMSSGQNDHSSEHEGNQHLPWKHNTQINKLLRVIFRRNSHLCYPSTVRSYNLLSVTKVYQIACDGIENKLDLNVCQCLAWFCLLSGQTSSIGNTLAAWAELFFMLLLVVIIITVSTHYWSTYGY